jgi:hypothetical protein
VKQFDDVGNVQRLPEDKLHELLEKHYDYTRPDIRCFCMNCESGRFWWKNQYKMPFPQRPDWAFKSQKFREANIEVRT